ncbi:hypothetical protein [Methylobacterium sp. CM6247]
MRQISKLIGASAIVMLSSAMAFAAPCATGSTADGKAAMNDKSSKVDPGATGNVSPGAKAESPGTVGAMNNVGANTATSASDVAKQQDGKPTAADATKGC